MDIHSGLMVVCWYVYNWGVVIVLSQGYAYSFPQSYPRFFTLHSSLNIECCDDGVVVAGVDGVIDVAGYWG